MTPRRSFAFWLTVLALMIVPAAGNLAWSAEPAVGTKVFETLRSLGGLDDYLAGTVREITADLVRAANRWGASQVNGPYRPGGVNVYLVDSGRLPERPVLAGHGINQGRGLGRYDLEGGALTDEPTGIVFIDTGMVKELVASIGLTPEGESSMKALALVRTRGLDAYRTLWDPAQNPSLRAAADRAQRLPMLVGGALGFVIAHEMGHLTVAPPPIASGARPPRLLTGKDRDASQACPALMDPAHLAKQRVERAADDFAVGLLERRCGAWTPQQPEHLIYELGARWYFVYSMSRTLLATGNVTQSPNIHQLLRTNLGPDLYQAVIGPGARDDRGSVHLTFPSSHPPDYERAERLEQRMSQSTCSLFRGEGGSRHAGSMEIARQQVCRDLTTKIPPR